MRMIQSDHEVHERLEQDEVMRRMRAGETIRNAHIGRLRFDQPQQLCGLSIKNSIIDGLDIKNCDIQAVFDLEGCSIVRRSFIRGAKFRALTIFRRVQFQKGVEFSDTDFDARTHFNMAEFPAWSAFKKVRFQNRTLFSKANFPAGVEFLECQLVPKERVPEKSNNYSFNNLTGDQRFHMHKCVFGDNITFTGARFEDIVEFDDSVFERHVRIKHARFSSSVSFRRVTFKGEFHLNGTYVDGDLKCHQAHFQGLVNLKAIYGQRNVDFKGAIASGQAAIQLSQAHFGRLHIDRSLIAEHLESLKNDDFECARVEFGILKHAFRDINAYDEEDWCYLMEKRMERMLLPWDQPMSAASRFFNWLALDLGCGYGTKPLNVFIASMILLFAFVGVFMAVPGAFPEPISFFDAVQLSFRIFVNAEVSSVEPKSTHWMNYVLMVESFLGFFVMMVLVVTYSRRVIR